MNELQYKFFYILYDDDTSETVELKHAWSATDIYDLINPKPQVIMLELVDGSLRILNFENAQIRYIEFSEKE